MLPAGVQVMLRDTAEYLRELDKLATSETPTEATVVRRCHSWVGTAFMTWIDGEPAALGKHIQVVRDACKLEISLVEVLHRHGKSVQVCVDSFRAENGSLHKTCAHQTIPNLS